MRRGGIGGLSAKTSLEQFRTPDKPPTTGPATISNKRTATPTSSASTFRPWKRTSLTSARDQPTLTQIDFVTQISQPRSDDDDLDYIADAPKYDARKSKEVIAISDDSGNDAEYRPSSHSRSRQTRGVRFDQDTDNGRSKQTKMVSQSAGPSKGSRRKSGDSVKGIKKGKAKEQKNKTLTQMDYVRRYLKIEPDEDVKLEYTYTTPQKHERKPHIVHHPTTEDTPRGLNDTHAASSEHKRRKMNDDSRPNEEAKPAGDYDGTRLFGGPVTPRKVRESEIPSSQSPESPGLAIISSSQFRSATRSPLKRTSPTPTIKRIKTEPPSHDQIGGVRETILPSRNTTQPSMKPHSPPSNKHIPKDSLETNTCSTTQSQSSKESVTPKVESKADDGSGENPRTTQKTVIYETDAETESGDFQDHDFNVLGSPSEKISADRHLTYEGEEDDDEMPKEDSQDLPPLPTSGLDVESVPLPSELNLPSDASIYYRRPQQATQFPLEPIPAIDTQKMAELFPDYQQESTAVSRPQSSPASRTLHCPSLYTPTQDPDKASTEIIPESSPTARCESGMSANKAIHRGPVTRESVVQVESSQPADRFQRKTNTNKNSGPRGILSSSQLLTSSVMESIPMPMFLLGSQDSLEPYSDT